MRFKATPDQVRQIIANAVNAAKPSGLPVMHPQDNNFQAREFVPAGVEYFAGRMIKIQIWDEGEGIYHTQEAKPHPDYQTWFSKYPTWEALVGSVKGVEILPDGK